MRKNAYRPALAVSLVGIMAAMLECIKLALAFLPNIEALTLFVALFGYAFGWLGVAATVVFVAIEPMIYGFGSWVISYFLYWPFVAVAFMVLKKLRVGGRVLPTVAATVLTLWFGVLTSLVDVGLFSGSFDNFFYRFFIMYARGVAFYALQLGCNIVLFFLLFPFLSDLVCRLRRSILPSRTKTVKQKNDDGEQTNILAEQATE